MHLYRWYKNIIFLSSQHRKVKMCKVQAIFNVLDFSFFSKILGGRDMPELPTQYP